MKRCGHSLKKFLIFVAFYASLAIGISMTFKIYYFFFLKKKTVLKIIRKMQILGPVRCHNTP